MEGGVPLTEFPADSSRSVAVAGQLSSTRRKQHVYHHCKRLRRCRDELLEHPGCLVFLVVLVTIAAVFFGWQAWWVYTRRWPGLFENQVLEAPHTVQQRFEQIGCYRLEEGDDAMTVITDLYDYTCMSGVALAGGALCRSGLPFYSFTVPGDHALSWRMCAELCILKGMDISGVTDSTLCRCGATAGNKAIWGAVAERSELLWQPRDARVGDESPECSIVAARYVGPMPIPKRELDLNERDLAYVQSVLMGKKVLQLADTGAPLDRPPVLDLSLNDYRALEQETTKPTKGTRRRRRKLPFGFGPAAKVIGGSDEEHDVPGAAGRHVLVPDSENQSMDLQTLSFGWSRPTLRPCFPHQCAAGIPWPIWTTYATGIPFAFAEDVQEETREAFRAAIMAYHAATCILFTEVSPEYDEEYKIFVKDDEDGCFTAPVGYPLLYRQDTEINLGWCNTERTMGNMIHELGHAMGMAHEHMRPDRDKYVHIDYEGMSPVMQAQYAEDDSAYVGSSDKGHAPYDFGSLMHYPATPQMRTLPIVKGRGVHDAETGQRRGFSVEDVKQLRDMYQCDNEKGDFCEDMNTELGAAISIKGRPATCYQVRKYCTNPKFGREIKYFCAKTCDACPERVRPTTPGPGVKGCEDASPFCGRYKAYCPGRHVVGEEQWMAENCRKTCQIPKHCGGGKRGAYDADSSAADSEASDAAPLKADICIDSAQTGLMNALGQMDGCPGLVDKCHDNAIGSQVRAACPATCGLCRDATKMTIGQRREGQVTMVASFKINNDGYDLADEEQEAELNSTLRDFVKEIYRGDVSSDISKSDWCNGPCREGQLEVTGICCKVMVKGCNVDCEELRTQLSRFTAGELTSKLARRGLAGVTVQKVSVNHSWAQFSASIFSGFYVQLMTGVAAIACVCLSFAITHASCFKQKGSRDLGQDLISDEEEAEGSVSG